MIEKARLLMATGRYERVPEMLLPVTVCSDREMAEFAHRLLIGCAIMKGDGQAVEFAQNALCAGFNTVSIHKYTALAYEEAGLYRRALKHINISLKDDPNDGDCHRVKATIALNDSRYPLARIHGERALELEPENVEAMSLVAATLLNTGRGDAAKKMAQKTLSLDPTDENALAIMGLIQSNMGKKREIFRRLLTIDPHHEQGAIEYRKFTNNKDRRLVWPLFSGYTAITLVLYLFPVFTESAGLTPYLFLYFPAAWVLGKHFRISLFFYGLNIGFFAHAQMPPFDDLNPLTAVIIGAMFSCKFWAYRHIFDFFKGRVLNLYTGFRHHKNQGSMPAKILEEFDKIFNADSALIVIGNLSIFSSAMAWVPVKMAWFAFLPLVLLPKYKGRSKTSFWAMAMPVILTDIAMAVAAGDRVWFSLLMAGFLILVQLFIVYYQYLGEVRCDDVG